jgi:uncharacterized membrane protein (DUF2068 family)
MTILRRAFGLRAIAVFEIFKGGLALIGLGLVATGKYTVPGLFQRMVAHLHLDPSGTIAHFLLDVVAQISPWVLAWLAIAYVTLRFAEAYGLWHERHWAEWLAAVSSAIYVPVEVHELVVHPSGREVATLVVNIAIVVFLVWVLWKTRARRMDAQRAAAGKASTETAGTVL